MPSDQTKPPASADDTIALLERARAGDETALNELFARHVPLLQRWASGRLPKWARDVSDTSDLVQETVMETFKRLDTFEPRGEGALQAYLRQAIVNRIRTHIRRASARPEPVALESGVPAEDTSPLEAAIGQQTVERYEAALDRLKPDEREAIVTRVEFGLSFAEVAEVLGKPSADAARMAVVRALVRLAEEMNRQH
ncbi:MAG: RNA polymerase sigma factor [Acidobacteria bacterium]|nr:RNA polymerase sigma factor [Acidobacteriota bacterium]